MLFPSPKHYLFPEMHVEIKKTAKLGFAEQSNQSPCGPDTRALCFDGATLRHISLPSGYVFIPQTLTLIPHYVVSSQYWPLVEGSRIPKSPQF